MVAEFAISSVNDSTRLEFSGEIPRGLEGYDGATFDVALTGGPVSASVEVYDIKFAHWSAFFADLAANWRGWSGTKTCESLEGHLFLEASADRAGHVQLRVRLRGMVSDDDWRAEVRIHLEAGQLDQLASRAAQYFG